MPASCRRRRGNAVCAAAMPIKARRTRPWRTSSPSTKFAVFDAMAKQMPCAPMMMAVLMPTTSPCEDTSGPPELPGLSAASVWIRSSISRPVRARSERPSAETTPAVTVEFEAERIADRDHQLAAPQPLGIAERRRRQRNPSRSTRTSARSVSGSSPTTRAVRVRPSAVVTATRAAPPTTWLLVRIRPSGETITPEPEPAAAVASAHVEATTAGPCGRRRR